MQNPVYIHSIASVSPFGKTLEEAYQQYTQKKHCFQQIHTLDSAVWAATLPEDTKQEVLKLKDRERVYRHLDNTVLYAMYVAEKAVQQANWQNQLNFGVNIGSSRGATQLLESYFNDFYSGKRVSVQASPSTTLGNVASWVAHHVQTKGPEISHSITCSTALHAMLNGIAWLESGMSDAFLVGGTEAAITPFTLAQMQALQIYSKIENATYPCLALDCTKAENTMILGEAASVACISKSSENALAKIVGIGYATEPLKHGSSISTDAVCFQRSMAMAMQNHDTKSIDVIITHTPGTIMGDKAELEAIKKTFKNYIPALTTNKWQLGHTFAASGMLSIEMAILMLQKQTFFEVPYLQDTKKPEKIEKILVNAVGFGGNAVSILLSI